MIIGLVELGNNLREIAEDLPGLAAKALYEEGKIELKEAKRRTPVKTGALQKSGDIIKWDGNRADIKVTITFGVPTPYYAIYVHENLEAIHPNGQAKFLESTLLESAPFIAARVSARITFDRYGK